MTHDLRASDIVPANLKIDLAGRTAVVTGGGGDGLGRGFCIAFASLGANVVIATRRAVTGQPVVDEIRGFGGEACLVVTDVGERSQVEQAVRHAVGKYGALDIMVHNALGGGLPKRYRLEDVTQEWWDTLSRTAVWGSYFSAKAAYPHLAASRHGRFILTSSPSGIEGSHNIPIYSPVKAAQRALAKSLAREWGRDHITVNTVAPVAITGAHKQALAANPVYAERIQGRTAIGQLGDEKEIAAVVAWLASDSAAYVTGQTIVCDGGGFLGL
jgi:NAD(P)-dependent dehydrogenase (short-subunit alcohol dehydrogenase family)